MDTGEAAGIMWSSGRERDRDDGEGEPHQEYALL